jgi:endonuclease/exonuclease/phosphatase family metal-dependent hydrolase
MPRLSALITVLVLAVVACEERPGIPDISTPTEDGVVPDLPVKDGPRGPDGTVAPPVTLTIGSYNVRDFFDDVDDPAHQDTVLTAAQVAAKIKALGAAIRAINADILALAEVENKALLDRLVSEELPTLKYTYSYLKPGNDARGINVALLSRYAPRTTVSHVGDRFPGVDGDTTNYGFSRDCLELVFEPSTGRRLVLLINHLRATDFGTAAAESIARRYAQAARVRQIADQYLKTAGANVAVVGDMNDTPGSKTLNLLINGTPPLFDVTTLVATADRWTHLYDSKKEQLDYILVSPGMKEDLVTGSVQIPHTQIFKDASDHYPVSARFNLK